MWSCWLGIGAASLAYGLRGERIPGKIITLKEDSDNGLRLLERIAWVIVGMVGLANGVLEFLSLANAAR